MNTFEKMILIMDRQLSTGLARGLSRPAHASSAAGERSACEARFEHRFGERAPSAGTAQSLDDVVVLGEN